MEENNSTSWKRRLRLWSVAHENLTDLEKEITHATTLKSTESSHWLRVRVRKYDLIRSSKLRIENPLDTKIQTETQIYLSKTSMETLQTSMLLLQRRPWDQYPLMLMTHINILSPDGAKYCTLYRLAGALVLCLNL